MAPPKRNFDQFEQSDLQSTDNQRKSLEGDTSSSRGNSHGGPLPSSDMDTSQSTSGADTRNETVSAIPKNYVCFGSIVDAIALLKPGAEKSVVPDERLTKHFHIQAVGGYFGLFDSETCVAVLTRKMSELIRSLTDNRQITLKAIISSHRWSLKVKNLRKEPKSTFSKVDLYIYGIETDAAQVGDILCTAKINLQRPLTDIDGMRYVNPHYLPISHSSSEDVKSLRVRSSMRPGGADLGRKPSDSSSFDTDVQSILNSLSHNEILHAEPVDGKVRSELYMHQKHAIDYIFKRETGQLPPELMLWRFNDDDDSAKFWEHKITGAQELDPHEIKGGIIADEMGLGKSLVVLSSIAGSIDRSFRYLERMHESYARVSAQISNPPSPSHATLIIVPSSMLIDSWMEEISRHILQGSLDVFRFHGDKRKSDAKLLSTSNIVITTYATVASDAVSKSRILQNINWFRIVLDEAHYVRNSRTKSFEAINSLVSEHRWCLTGTPIQNGLDDLGSLLSFLKIPVFEHPATFKQLISSRIDSSFMQIWNPKPLRVLLASICLRRTRESVKLPQPSLQQRLLELNTVEREQYMAILSSTGYASQMAVSKRGSTKMSSAVLQGILKLRLFCNHGVLYQAGKLDKNGRPNDPDVVLSFLQQDDRAHCVYCGTEIFTIDDAKEADGGHLMKCMHLVCQQCMPQHTAQGEKCPECASNESTSDLCYSTMDLEHTLTNQLSSLDKQEYPTKLLAFLQDVRCDSRSPVRRKSIAFSSWKRTLDIAASLLKAEGIRFCCIHGGLSPSKRLEVLEHFRSPAAHGADLLLITLGTGAVGLNLAVATKIYLLEPQWNPYIEHQALSRAIRLGQANQVTIINYITKDTIEQDNILQRQDLKRSLVTKASL